MSCRQAFANSINRGASIMTDCEKFGMTWGCREDCPQLERGECEIYKDVDDFIKSEEAKQCHAKNAKV